MALELTIQVESHLTQSGGRCTYLLFWGCSILLNKKGLLNLGTSNSDKCFYSEKVSEQHNIWCNAATDKSLKFFLKLQIFVYITRQYLPLGPGLG